jgi:hypothetical protein
MICDIARTFQCQFILRKNKFQRESAFALSAGVDPGDHPLFSSLMQIKPALLNSIRLEKTESERRRCSRQKNKFHTSQDEIRSASKSARETTERDIPGITDLAHNPRVFRARHRARGTPFCTPPPPPLDGGGAKNCPRH